VSTDTTTRPDQLVRGTEVVYWPAAEDQGASGRMFVSLRTDQAGIARLYPAAEGYSTAPVAGHLTEGNRFVITEHSGQRVPFGAGTFAEAMFTRACPEAAELVADLARMGDES
jgi:hypothetical protein